MSLRTAPPFDNQTDEFGVRENLSAPNGRRRLTRGGAFKTETRGRLTLQGKREEGAEALMKALPGVDGRRSWKAETEAKLLPRCGRKYL
jgi:hypothetical protein